MLPTGDRTAEDTLGDAGGAGAASQQAVPAGSDRAGLPRPYGALPCLRRCGHVHGQQLHGGGRVDLSAVTRGGQLIVDEPSPSSSRASRSGAIRIGWCGPWTSGFYELGRCPLVAHKPPVLGTGRCAGTCAVFVRSDGSACEEGHKFRHNLIRCFFHQPVARALDDHALDMVGNQTPLCDQKFA